MQTSVPAGHLLGRAMFSQAGNVWLRPFPRLKLCVGVPGWSRADRCVVASHPWYWKYPGATAGW